ncbi:hypothetical protein ACFQ34_32315, partial [Pseudonocardia benzenivorans]
GRVGVAVALELPLDLGDRVDAGGRGDGPGHDGWNTALHEAALRADHDMVALLLARGADPTVRDARFDATPAGWAAHAGHSALAAELTAREERHIPGT